jgi:hypothetical protein
VGVAGASARADVVASMDDARAIIVTTVHMVFFCLNLVVVMASRCGLPQ